MPFAVCALDLLVDSVNESLADPWPESLTPVEYLISVSSFSAFSGSFCRRDSRAMVADCSSRPALAAWILKTTSGHSLHPLAKAMLLTTGAKLDEC